MFLPAEIRTDKLAPRSELMTYLGNAPGVKGWLFMRSPNNILFTAAQAPLTRHSSENVLRLSDGQQQGCRLLHHHLISVPETEPVIVPLQGMRKRMRRSSKLLLNPPLPLQGKEREKLMNQVNHLPLLLKRKKNLKFVLPQPHRFLGLLGHKENVEYQLNQEMSMGSLDIPLTY